jgi:predicted alpha/beta-hydrolase family hydrolase
MAAITSIATTITGPEGKVSGRLAGSGPTGILLAHGAGTDQEHPFMVSLRDGLAGAGHTVMTFNYPYTERGAKRPDRTEVLVRCHRAAADHLAARVDHLFLAGRSMGGRMATYLVAEGYPAAGVVLYAYPLHPPGMDDRLRIDLFAEVEVPLLFFQGTRDALSRMELFDRHLRPLPNATVEVLEGASHSFRGGGWAEEAMLERLVSRTTQWIESVRSGKRPGSGP